MLHVYMHEGAMDTSFRNEREENLNRTQQKRQIDLYIWVRIREHTLSTIIL